MSEVKARRVQVIKSAMDMEDSPAPQEQLFEFLCILDHDVRDDVFLVLWKDHNLNAATWEQRVNVRDTDGFSAFCAKKYVRFGVDCYRDGAWRSFTLEQKPQDALMDAIGHGDASFKLGGVDLPLDCLPGAPVAAGNDVRQAMQYRWTLSNLP